MKVQQQEDATAWLEICRESLLEQEALHGLILGVAQMAERKKTPYGYQPLFWTVEDAGRLQLMALRTPPFNLLLASAGESSREALAALARSLVDQELPGVTAPLELAEGFRDLWIKNRKIESRVKMRLRCYELREVIEPPKPSGRARLARENEQELITEWILAFSEEATEGLERERAEEMAATKIAREEVLLWEDGGVPVSMAAGCRATGKGIALNLVYTPRDRRRVGYATALVADLSARYLESGLEFCTLFTDLDFPTSNLIYRKVGYRPISDFLEIGFADEEPQ